MRNVTYYCDRCTAEIERMESAEWDTLVRELAADSPLFGYQARAQPDLCIDCLRGLKEWFKNE